MVFDQTGSLANMKRHDYLPFGEEIGALSDRSSANGYGGGDGVRQQFTLKERDFETGLDTLVLDTTETGDSQLPILLCRVPN